MRRNRPDRIGPRHARPLATGAILGLVVVLATSCQFGVKMWQGCDPAAPGGAYGSDGSYVLVCRERRWEPVMTLEEYSRFSHGDHVTFAPKPPVPTLATTHGTAALDQVSDGIRDMTDRVGTPCSGNTSTIIGQSFAARQDGHVVAVSLWLDTVGHPPPLSVEIMAVGSKGWWGSNPMGGGSVPEPVSGWVDVQMADPVPLIKGSTYVIRLSVPGCPDPDVWQIGATSASTAPGSRCQGDGWWWSCLVSGLTQGDGDLLFKTWIVK